MAHGLPRQEARIAGFLFTLQHFNRMKFYLTKY